MRKLCELSGEEEGGVGDAGVGAVRAFWRRILCWSIARPQDIMQSLGKKEEEVRL